LIMVGAEADKRSWITTIDGITWEGGRGFIEKGGCKMSELESGGCLYGFRQKRN